VAERLGCLFTSLLIRSGPWREPGARARGAGRSGEPDRAELTGCAGYEDRAVIGHATSFRRTCDDPTRSHRYYRTGIRYFRTGTNQTTTEFADVSTTWGEFGRANSPSQSCAAERPPTIRTRRRDLNRPVSSSASVFSHSDRRVARIGPTTPKHRARDCARRSIRPKRATIGLAGRHRLGGKKKQRPDTGLRFREKSGYLRRLVLPSFERG
jgi:hypothetical protein